MVLLFMTIIWTIIIAVDSCGPAWNTGGSCYSGYRAAGVGDLAVISEFEQCYGDKNNWCTVRFDQITGDTDYHCYNWYARSGIAAMQCGDLPGEINNGGCSQISLYGRNCLLCCCRGANCNNPVLFQTAVQQYYYGNHATNTIIVTNFLVFVFIIIMF